MRRLASLLSGLAVALSIAAAPAAAGGPPTLSFYVDGDQYRTIGTPTDLSRTGAPSHSFDTIYDLGFGLANVAEAAPGDRDYNGGRWQVRPITWLGEPSQLKSAAEVLDLARLGELEIGEPVKFFVCPVIPVGGRR